METVEETEGVDWGTGGPGEVETTAMVEEEGEAHTEHTGLMRARRPSPPTTVLPYIV